MLSVITVPYFLYVKNENNTSIGEVENYMIHSRQNADNMTREETNPPVLS